MCNLNIGGIHNRNILVLLRIWVIKQANSNQDSDKNIFWCCEHIYSYKYC